MAEALTTRVWVGIRPRPLEAGLASGFEFDATRNTVNAVGDATRTAYSFDRVFGYASDSREVYQFSTQRVVQGVLAGINGTVFAYGQTGSGKTHTMSALTRMAAAEMFQTIRMEEHQYSVRVSIVELYCEKFRDLLQDAKGVSELRLVEDAQRGYVVAGVTEAPISNEQEFELLLKKGEARRATGATAMNDTSSRSHLILTLRVECVQAGEPGVEPASRLACLNLVDLAGSEGGKTAQTTGQRLIEAKDINRSLLALSVMLRDCSESSGVNRPYRDSKLTMLLRSAIGGNCWTSIVGCVAPSPEHREQSLQTLDFASRARLIQNKVTMNVLEDPLTAMTRAYLAMKKKAEQLRIFNESLTARVARGELTARKAMGGRPTPSKETPRATPLRHSHGGTPFGGVWSAAKFMLSVQRPDLAAKKLDMFSVKKRLPIGVDEDGEEAKEGDDVVPATPFPTKSAIPLFQLEDDSPPKLCEMVPEAKLLTAQNKIAELSEEIAALKNESIAPVVPMVPESELTEALNWVKDLQRDNSGLRTQTESAVHRETALLADKQALAARLTKLEGELQSSQQANAKLTRELDLVQSRFEAWQVAAQTEAKHEYRDRERDMAIEWRQERMKIKEANQRNLEELQRKQEEEMKTAAKQARQNSKQFKTALAEKAAREKELLASLEAAQKALEVAQKTLRSKAGENSVAASAKRKAAPSALRDVTNTVTKRTFDSKVAKGLSFESTCKKVKHLQIEYKMDKKPCRRLRLEANVASDMTLDEVRQYLIRELTNRDAEVATIANSRRQATLVREIEKNLWKNHNYGTSFSKDLMPEDDQDLIVESILWAELIQKDGRLTKVILRCRFKEWWNGEYVGHLSDEARDKYVASLDKDLGVDVLLEKLDAPDLLQYFVKNLVTRRQWQMTYDYGMDAQRKEEAKRKPKTGVAKVQAELEAEMRIVSSPTF